MFGCALRASVIDAEPTLIGHVVVDQHVAELEATRNQRRVVRVGAITNVEQSPMRHHIVRLHLAPLERRIAGLVSHAEAEDDDVTFRGPKLERLRAFQTRGQPISQRLRVDRVTAWAFGDDFQRDLILLEVEASVEEILGRIDLVAKVGVEGDAVLMPWAPAVDRQLCSRHHAVAFWTLAVTLAVLCRSGGVPVKNVRERRMERAAAMEPLKQVIEWRLAMHSEHQVTRERNRARGQHWPSACNVLIYAVRHGIDNTRWQHVPKDDEAIAIKLSLHRTR